MIDVFNTFDDAAGARTDDESVCGVRLEDGSDRYFLMPADTPDGTIHDRAFEIRHGKPMTSYQRTIMDLAQDRKSDHATAS